jgi:tetratricopeptide (TPR) repeat protein
VRERTPPAGGGVRLPLLLLLAPLLVGFDLLQSPNHAVEQGNVQLKAGKADEALGHYDKAAKSLSVEPGMHFDRGAALFALSRFDEAVPEFLRATEAKSPALKEAAFYNLGNGLFKQEKFGDAVAAYRRALGIDPTDMRAKWNLELALKKKKDQDDKDKQKDKQSQNDKKKQDNKDQSQKQPDKQDQDQKDQQAKKDPDQQKDPPPKKDEQAKHEDKSQGAADKDKDKDKDKAKDEKEPGESVADTPPPPSSDTPDMREIEAVLDNLERNPKDLEKERARARAVRRAPPRKNW